MEECEEEEEDEDEEEEEEDDTGESIGLISPLGNRNGPSLGTRRDPVFSSNRIRAIGHFDKKTRGEIERSLVFR
jgi:hypothetical protein